MDDIIPIPITWGRVLPVSARDASFSLPKLRLSESYQEVNSLVSWQRISLEHLRARKLLVQGNFLVALLLPSNEKGW